MAEQADFTDWQQVIALLKTAVSEGKEESLLTLLLTPDERESLLGRVNIVNELLKGELSQRQMSQLLGVGVATITRGSNGLKQQDDATKAWLDRLLADYRNQS